MKRHILYKELALISRLNHEQSETIKDLRDDIIGRDNTLRGMQKNMQQQSTDNSICRGQVKKLADELKDANQVLTKYKGEFTQQVERIKLLEIDNERLIEVLADYKQNNTGGCD